MSVPGFRTYLCIQCNVSMANVRVVILIRCTKNGDSLTIFFVCFEQFIFPILTNSDGVTNSTWALSLSLILDKRQCRVRRHFMSIALGIGVCIMLI